MEFAQRLISTRRGSLYVAARRRAARRRRRSSSTSTATARTCRQAATPVTVLVARSTIPKGTSGNVDRDEAASTPRRRSARASCARARSAIPRACSGRVATHGDLRGRAAHGGRLLRRAPTRSPAALTRPERVVSVPLDAAHGLDRPGRRRATTSTSTPASTSSRSRPTAGRSTAAQARPVLRLIMSDIPVVADRQSADGRREANERQPARQRREGGAARVRVGQRQGLARRCGQRSARRSPARHRHRRDAAARRPAGERAVRSLGGRR